MKKYTRPSFEVLELETTDIIQTSGQTSGGTLTDGGAEGDFTGGGANAGWGTSTTSANLFD